MILNSIKIAFRSMKKRNWNTLYFAIDLHNTVCPGYYKAEQKLEFYPYSKRALQMMSDIPFVKLILYTSTSSNTLDRYISWLSDNGIKFDYINENGDNPVTTEYADFSDKFYFNVLIDDKAGFQIYEWKEIYDYLRLGRHKLDIKKEIR